MQSESISKSNFFGKCRPQPNNSQIPTSGDPSTVCQRPPTASQRQAVEMPLRKFPTQASGTTWLLRELVRELRRLLSQVTEAKRAIILT